MKPTASELEHRFSYHPPRNDAIREDHEAVSRLTLQLAKDLTLLLPEGRNLSLVLTHLEDVRMRANAALACDGVEILQRAD